MEEQRGGSSGEPGDERNATYELPLGIRVAAAWSWRLIIIALASAALLWGIVQVRIIVVPVLIAILLTALLMPIVSWFERRGLPRWSGVLSSLILLFATLWVLMIFGRARSA